MCCANVFESEMQLQCKSRTEHSSTLNHVLSGNENAFSSHLQFWHFQIEFVIELVASNYHFGQREMQPATVDELQLSEEGLRINKYNRIA